MSVAAKTQLMDCSQERYMPICLRFDDVLTKSPFCTLTELVSLWHQVDGMTTVSKCTSKLQIDEECFFPVFTGDTRQCDYYGYTVVAIMSHLGEDCAGHYRSALKVNP